MKLNLAKQNSKFKKQAWSSVNMFYQEFSSCTQDNKSIKTLITFHQSINMFKEVIYWICQAGEI